MDSVTIECVCYLLLLYLNSINFLKFKIVNTILFYTILTPFYLFTYELTDNLEFLINSSMIMALIHFLIKFI